MAWQKGKPRPEGAGRKKGTPNKATQDLLLICEQEGIEPFRAMIRAYKEMEMPLDQFNAAERIAQYIYPKRKAIEHSGVNGEDIGIKIVIEDYGVKK